MIAAACYAMRVIPSTLSFLRLFCSAVRTSHLLVIEQLDYDGLTALHEERGGMARLALDEKRSKPWKAEIKHEYVPRFLGYFHTRDEAEAAERDMRVLLKGTPDPVRKAVF